MNLIKIHLLTVYSFLFGGLIMGLALMMLDLPIFGFILEVSLVVLSAKLTLRWSNTKENQRVEARNKG